MNAASLEIFYPENRSYRGYQFYFQLSTTRHHSHLFEPESAPLLPAGATLVIKQWYDNTENNPNNPDPRQWVGWGQRTADEMSHAWIAVSHLNEETYQELLAQRTENAKSGSSADD